MCETFQSLFFPQASAPSVTELHRGYTKLFLMIYPSPPGGNEQPSVLHSVVVPLSFSCIILCDSSSRLRARLTRPVRGDE